MANYQTRPRRQILQYLKEHPEKGFTAEELACALQQQFKEDAPGKSTVYRLLGRMVREEALQRFEESGSKSARFRLPGQTCHEHLHLKCLDCGRLLHMEEETSEQLLKEIFKTNGFAVDEYRTILVGRCDSCAGKEEA